MSIRLAAALLFASMMVSVGCSEPASSGDSVNGSAGSGGVASSGGSASGGAGSGGVGGGGASSGGSTSGGAGSGGVGGGGASNGGTGGGSSCSESGGTSVTSLSGSCPLNSLSAAQATKLCEDTGAYVKGALSKANSCKYLALVAAASSSAPTDEELQNACSTSESACNADAASTSPGVLCTEIPATCSATVAEYATCITDETTAFDQGVSELVSCSMLTFESVSTIYDVPDNASQAASCMALTTMCPGFFPPYIN